MGYKAPKVEVRYVAPFEPLFRVLDESGEVEQVTAGQNELGQEMPDPVPVAPPVGYKPGPTLQDTILHMLKQQALRVAADTADFDSPEEADDFEIEDDPLDPLTPYEAEFLPQDELRSRLTELDKAIKHNEAVKKAAKLKEQEDGDTDPDERRVEHRTSGTGRRSEKRKGEPEPEQDADDERSVRKADRRNTRTDEQDSD